MCLGKFESIWVALGKVLWRWRDSKLNTLRGMDRFECVWVGLGRFGSPWVRFSRGGGTLN